MPDESSPARRCPVCKIGRIYRREQRTCCRVCMSEWNKWSPEQQARAIEQADEPAADAGELSEWLGNKTTLKEIIGKKEE